ncbi:MAG: hypothetical protein ACOYNL_06690 [Rickettsiales bacterium]
MQLVLPPIDSRPVRKNNPAQAAADFEEARLRLRYLLLEIGGIDRVVEALNTPQHTFHYVAKDCRTKHRKQANANER